jgi:hypothetical protein
MFFKEKSRQWFAKKNLLENPDSGLQRKIYLKIHMVVFKVKST